MVSKECSRYFLILGFLEREINKLHHLAACYWLPSEKLLIGVTNVFERFWCIYYGLYVRWVRLQVDWSIFRWTKGLTHHKTQATRLVLNFFYRKWSEPGTNPSKAILSLCIFEQNSWCIKPCSKIFYSKIPHRHLVVFWRSRMEHFSSRNIFILMLRHKLFCTYLQ